MTAKPEILFVSLQMQSFFDEMYSSWIDEIKASATLKRAKTSGGAIKFLEANNPKAVIISDEGLTLPENGAVLIAVANYLRNGGRVVVGFHFTNNTRMDAFDAFFKNAFGVPWKHGAYHRTTFQFNSNCALPAGTNTSGFPEPYSMKVLHVSNAKPQEKVFIPIDGAKTQSNVFAPQYVDQSEAAVVCAKVGEGYLAYIGDVNTEDESIQVIKTICGL